MAEKNPFDDIRSELGDGMALAKCRKCGCMKDTLDSLHSTLQPLDTTDNSELLEDLRLWRHDSKNGWVTQLGHAAYLGRELMRAAFSLKHGFRFIQDGA